VTFERIRKHLPHFYSALLRMQSAVMSVCQFIRLSETFRYRDHIGWNTSKIISWAFMAE